MLVPDRALMGGHLEKNMKLRADSLPFETSTRSLREHPVSRHVAYKDCLFRDMPPTRTARFATPLHRKIPLPLPFYGEFLGGVILVFHVFLEILNPLYLEKLLFRFNDMSSQECIGQPFWVT